MQPIDTTFDEGRFHYTQLERRGDIAIYRQDKPCQHRLCWLMRFCPPRIQVLFL